MYTQLRGSSSKKLISKRNKVCTKLKGTYSLNKAKAG